MNLGNTIGQAAADAVREQQVRWVAHEIGSWAIQQVREYVAELNPTYYTRWQTADDERTCPICGQLEGMSWKQDDGYFPPVHDHCRCERVYDRTEFTVRYVETYRTQATYTTRTEWRQER